MALLLSRKFCFWSERYLHSCGTRKKTLGLWEWGTNSKHPDEWESIHSVITGQLSEGQRGSHTVHGVWETLSGRVLWENRCLMFVNSHRIFFFSLTYSSVLWPLKCTAPSSGAIAPTEMKARYIYFFDLYWVFFAMWSFVCLRRDRATL